MFNDNQRERENESSLDYYIGQRYTEAPLNSVNFRKITENEYSNVQFKFRNTNNYLVLPFFLMVGDIILTICGVVCSIRDAINHVENAALFIFVSFMLGLFGFVFCYIAYDNRKCRKVTRESLVEAGEIVEMRNAYYSTRGHQLVRADYIVALHNTRKLVTVHETTQFYCGDTVLVIKSDSSKYRLVKIPENAADFCYYAPDHSAELERMNIPGTYDYSKFRHVHIFETDIKHVTDEDYDNLPSRYKSVNPFDKGIYSILWTVFSGITLILIVLGIKFWLEHNAYFLPLCAALFCELWIQWLMNRIAFQRPLTKKNTFTVDGIVTKVISDPANNRLTLVMPDKQMFSEGIAFDNLLLTDIPLNVPVRLYFESQMNVLVKCCMPL